MDLTRTPLRMGNPCLRHLQSRSSFVPASTGRTNLTAAPTRTPGHPVTYTHRELLRFAGRAAGCGWDVAGFMRAIVLQGVTRGTTQRLVDIAPALRRAPDDPLRERTNIPLDSQFRSSRASGRVA